MYDKMLRHRLISLINEKGISEYQLSLDLGRSQSYIHSITSGQNLPSMSAFFEICSYFDITPTEFFDPNLHNPTLFHKITELLKNFNDDDLSLLYTLLTRLVSFETTQK